MKSIQAMSEFTEALGKVVEFQPPGKLHWHVKVRGNASPRFDDRADAERVAEELLDEYPHDRVWVKVCRGACK